ncbi:integration host factor subunit beta [Pelagibacteraceae bacterium]|nr:integration host factor subunit beta [Pelagibacteraceae bacterium]
MVKSEIIKKLKEKYPQLKIYQVENIFDLFIESIKDALIENRSVEIRKFMRFSTKIIKAKYNARNPKTGARIFVPEKKKVVIKMSKHLKEIINEKN